MFKFTQNYLDFNLIIWFKFIKNNKMFKIQFSKIILNKTKNCDYSQLLLPSDGFSPNLEIRNWPFRKSGEMGGVLPGRKKPRPIVWSLSVPTTLFEYRCFGYAPSSTWATLWRQQLGLFSIPSTWWRINFFFIYII